MPETDHVWTPEDDMFILDNFGTLSYQLIGERRGGLTRHQVRNRHLRLKAKIKELVMALHRVESTKPITASVSATVEANAVMMGEDITDKGGAGEARVFHMLTNTTRDLETMLEKCKVDMKFWQVKNVKLRKWDNVAKITSRKSGEDWVRDLGVTELWYVSVDLSPRENLPLLDLKADMIAEMKLYAPKYKQLPTPRHVGGKFMWEWCPFDHHFAKFCDVRETGSHYDFDEAERRWWDALDEHLGQVARYPISEILFPMGNDLLNFDNKAGTTTRGTPQDNSGRWMPVFKRVRTIMVKSIEKMNQIAPVTVKTVWGNHDEHSTFAIGDSLECWFNANRHVTVDNSARQRKYHAFGRVLLGFTHLDKEKHSRLPARMADEAADLWRPGQVREWHGGHLHASATGNPLQTIDGMKIRVLPSLCGRDAWHDNMGYCSLPQCESFMWHADQGLKNHFTSTVLVEDPARRSA